MHRVKTHKLERMARASAPGGRSRGREGEQALNITIIVNEAGSERGRGSRRGRRHVEQGGERPGRGSRRGHRYADHGGEWRGRGSRRVAHEGEWAGRESRRLEGRRVIGYLVETPDGRTRIIRKGEPGAGPGCGRRMRRREATL